MKHLFVALVAGMLAVAGSAPVPAMAQGDPLPSWNEGAPKTAIIDFVEAVTTAGSADFIAPPERVAVFDNDGTLWVEHPMYTQLIFALDRVKALAPAHPEWATTEPFKSALAGDMKALAATGEKGLMEIIAATHAGMSTEDFEAIVTDWIGSARDARFKRPYTDLVYQPMIEVMAYLRANEFETFIVSGGGIEFMRPWTQETYGVPPQNVVGSSIKTEFAMADGAPVLMRLPEMDFIDDKAGKPVGIESHIGRRPIAAFGNSDGDFEMLQWTTMAEGRRLGMIVHHTDAVREYAYDRDTDVGTLDKAMDAAEAQGWILIDMKADWARIFPGDAPQ